MYTREEFEELRINQASKMAKDSSLKTQAIDVLSKADEYHWVHQSNWFGEPCIQLPHDMFALQEIIFRTKPKYIIELGVCWGGSMLFYSTLFEALGIDGKVIGVDIYIPEDLKTRLMSHGKISDRIELIEASSIEQSTIDKINQITGGSKELLINLDSNHTHDHVLAELRMYNNLLDSGYYLVCGDTIVEDIPKQDHRKRDWGPGNNPKTALIQFLNENDQFKIDENIDNKLLFTCNPMGYLIKK